MALNRYEVIEIEFELLYALQSIHRPFLDWLMTTVSFLSNQGWIWIVLGIICCLFSRTRVLGGCILASLAIGFILGNVFLKQVIARSRPCWLDPSVSLLIPVPQDYSFPSGHSMVSFEGAVCIWRTDKRWGAAGLVLAGLTAFSRLYLFVHFPTDVLAGILLGTMIAFIVTRAAKNYQKQPLGKTGEGHD